MRGEKLLLLLAVFVAVAKCQQPKVSISPNFTHLGIFSGDLFYLKCEGGSGPVKWYFNNSKQSEINETLKITSAHPKHSGFYQCESNGKKSETLPIDVNGKCATWTFNIYKSHRLCPKGASLTIRTGQPVMQTGGSVILHLENEDGLQGWKCWVNRGQNQIKKILLRLKNTNDISINFQPSRLLVPETTFWCTDRNQNSRSNQITVSTSAYFQTITFYQNNKVIAAGSSATYNFTDVTESLEGSYRCCAKFTYKSHTAGSPFERVSDDHYVFVQDELPVTSILVGLVIGLGVLLVAVGVYCYRKKLVTGPFYENLAMRS
ncbi:hypothetical protein EXN66_Car020238 [Channa argus]|uniref:Ig-like domain-containing protein n=1 Tax=Channa argus TaxID=215402 RepID=A0A6G1QQD4_CHAAH|nr:hypothetical protein EXN66_Car020238 [Channa argus]